MNDDTFDQILRLTNERQRLWRLSGHGEATAEDRARIGQITDRLYVLWDQLRREIAANRGPQKTTYKPSRENTDTRRAA